MDIVRVQLKVIIFYYFRDPATNSLKTKRSLFSVSTHMLEWTIDASGILSVDNSKTRARITLQGVHSGTSL